MRKIIKPVHAKKSSIKKSKSDDSSLSFSFRFFDASDEEVCPATFQDGYTRTLMLRLKALSEWTVQKFTERPEKNMRNHKIDWADTSRPGGFGRLKQEHRGTQAWQFGVDETSLGRVHGFFIGTTFYIIWLDHHHKLYPMPLHEVVSQKHAALD